MSHCHLCFFPQLKAQMMLLEAQLEKQSDHQGAMEELEQVHELLRATTQKKQFLHHYPITNRNMFWFRRTRMLVIYN